MFKYTNVRQRTPPKNNLRAGKKGAQSLTISL